MHSFLGEIADNMSEGYFLYLFCAKVGITGLLFTQQGAIHRVVLVDLHRLHLLLDRVHFVGFVFLLSATQNILSSMS